MFAPKSNLLGYFHACHSIKFLWWEGPKAYAANWPTFRYFIEKYFKENVENCLLLFQMKEAIEAVSVGAILSDYQRVRVEHVSVSVKATPFWIFINLLMYCASSDRCKQISKLPKINTSGLKLESHITINTNYNALKGDSSCQSLLHLL